MKLLLDLLPVIAFFATFRLAKSFPEPAAAFAAALPGGAALTAATDVPDMVPVLIATLVTIVATLLQIGWLLARGERVKPMVWVSGALVVVFGGLTLYLHNPWFIKWKPTLLYLAFAAVLLGGRLAGRNLLGAVLGGELSLPARAWDRLLYLWSGFFVLLAGANLAVAYTLSTEAWVDFKTFGLLGLTLVFSLGTAFYVARFAEAPGVSPAGPAPASPVATAREPGRD